VSLVRNVSTVSCLLAGLIGCAALESSELIVYQDSKFSVSLVPDPSVDTSSPSRSTTILCKLKRTRS
jgi:hypothetical protein